MHSCHWDAQGRMLCKEDAPEIERFITKGNHAHPLATKILPGVSVPNIKPYINSRKNIMVKNNVHSKTPSLSTTPYPKSYMVPNYNIMPVLDQGSANTCTANAMANAMFYNMKVYGANIAPFFPSRDFLFRNEVSSGGGASISLLVSGLLNNGVCPEFYFPYNPASITSQTPSPYTTTMAKQYKSIDLLSITSGLQIVAQSMPSSPTAKLLLSLVQPNAMALIQDVKDAMMAHGPIIAGFQIPGNLQLDSSLWDFTSASSLDFQGHEVLLIGWNDTNQQFTFQNSWGTSWPQTTNNGIGHMTYNFFNVLVSGCHAIVSQQYLPFTGLAGNVMLPRIFPTQNTTGKVSSGPSAIHTL